MLIRKAQAGNIPGYHWEMDGDVLEIPEELAQEILRIPQGGFSVAEAAWSPYGARMVNGRLTIEELELEPEPPAPEDRRRGRPPLPRDERGRIIRSK